MYFEIVFYPIDGAGAIGRVWMLCVDAAVRAPL